jgi:hypothetical protein
MSQDSEQEQQSTGMMNSGTREAGWLAVLVGIWMDTDHAVVLGRNQWLWRVAVLSNVISGIVVAILAGYIARMVSTGASQSTTA